jgi:hypothetical protein
LDDISLVDGLCPLNENFGCDFDEDENICGFTNAAANFKWTRGSGKTPTENTGPSIDHSVIILF